MKLPAKLPEMALLEEYQYAISYCTQNNTFKIIFDTHQQAREFMQTLLQEEEVKHEAFGLIKGDAQAVVVLFLSHA
jgi:hypothetical protein